MILDGADQRGRVPGGAQDGIDQIGCGGFAVRAGDAGEAEALVGRAVEVPRGQCQRLPAVLDLDPAGRETRRAPGDSLATDDGAARHARRRRTGVRRPGCRETRRRGSPGRPGANRNPALRSEARASSGGSGCVSLTPESISPKIHRENWTRMRSPSCSSAPGGGVCTRAMPLPFGAHRDALRRGFGQHARIDFPTKFGHLRQRRRRDCGGGVRSAARRTPAPARRLPRHLPGYSGRAGSESAIRQIARCPPRPASGVARLGHVLRHSSTRSASAATVLNTGAAACPPKPAVPVRPVQRHHHHDRRIRHRREPQERSVVGVGVVLGGEVEDLRRSGLAAHRVPGQPRASCPVPCSTTPSIICRIVIAVSGLMTRTGGAGRNRLVRPS